jgi:hypothetical protein
MPLRSSNPNFTGLDGIEEGHPVGPGDADRVVRPLTVPKEHVVAVASHLYARVVGAIATSNPVQHIVCTFVHRYTSQVLPATQRTGRIDVK